METNRENAILAELAKFMLLHDIKIDCFKNANDGYEAMVQIESNDIIYIPKGTTLTHSDVTKAIEVRVAN